MKMFFTKLLLAACVLHLFALEIKAQEVDSLFMDSTINFTVKQMLDSCFKHVDLQQVPTGILLEKALVTADVKAFNGDAENDSAQCNAYLWRRLYGSLMRTY